MTPDANSFATELKVLKVPFYEMKPGETILYLGRAMLRK